MIDSKGWISLQRKIQDCWIWKEKPFSKGQAWIDMLLLANHSDNEFLLGNELMNVQRGSFITSEVKLSDRWGWSRTKVRAFLELLVNQKMIDKKSDNKKTTLTIVKYSDYQNIETAKEQQKNSEKTSKKHQKNTNNNDNNDNNVNNDNKSNSSRFTPPTLEEVRTYCLERKNTVDASRWVDFYSSKGWMVGKNKMTDWKSAVRTWERGKDSDTRRTNSGNSRTSNDDLTEYYS
ncbi:MAG TPA: hypothetical protein DHW61_11970 [Lachnoclostridium phytofermentans]|uniref:Phage protein n=1 Tax=Lachnoclostridium phytofermentans TaxID=66219 RepID=A0A3D2X920_9FIRM|nr:hypothetical protein [Lachnoclostridium sp.]HCL03103.1 hypothetical protein [Lachnoclostridium phytofermentans]